ncbi:hypothetical protein KAU32_13220 [bacterium]|nr:hypothetical protein [bacterium]
MKRINLRVNMKSMKMLLFTVMVTGLIFGTAVDVYCASEETRIKKLFTRFQSGWNSKNFERINSCLYKPNEKQERAYNIVKRFVEDVKMTMKINKIEVFGDFARANVTVKRKIMFDIKSEGIKKEVDMEAETLTYGLYKLDGKWKIIGLLDKDTIDLKKLKPKPITSENYETFMGKLNSMTEEEKKNLIKDSVDVEKTGKRISWFTMPNATYYSVQLSDKNPLSQAKGTELMKKEGITANSLMIPPEIYEKLEIGKNYFLLVEGYGKNDSKLGQYLLKIKKGAGNE